MLSRSRLIVIGRLLLGLAVDIDTGIVVIGQSEHRIGTQCIIWHIVLLLVCWSAQTGNRNFDPMCSWQNPDHPPAP